jgi:ribosome-interacting GTPase 1
MGLEEEIDALQEEIKSTPYNKATESHIGRLKSRQWVRRREDR